MSQNATDIFEYNGFKYEFDIRDADMAEAYQKAYNTMAEEEKSVPKAGKLSEIYRAQCGLIKRFFDRVLGEGAGDNVCGERSHVTNCYNAYFAFLDFVKEQSKDALEIKNTLSKYTNRPVKKPTDHKKSTK